MSANSLFVWQLKSYRRMRAEYPRRLADPRWRHISFVTLDSPGAAERWLESVAGGVDDA